MRPEDWISQASPEALEEMARLLVRHGFVSNPGIVDSTIEHARARCVARFSTVCHEFLSRARAEGDPIKTHVPMPTFGVMVSASVPGRAEGPGADSFMDWCGLLNMLDGPEVFGQSLAGIWCQRVQERHEAIDIERSLRHVIGVLAAATEDTP